MSDELRQAYLLTGNLFMLMALEANGMKRAAADLVDHIGRGLERTPAERRRQRYWSDREARRRVAQLSAPFSPPRPSPSLERDLKSLARFEVQAATARSDADAARKAGHHKGHRDALARLKDAQERIRILRRDIAAIRRDDVDRHWAQAAGSETEALANVRSEEVDEEDTAVPEWLRDPETGALVRGEGGMPVLRVERAKARRALSRSGLDLAFVRGDLGEGAHKPVELRETGRLYASAYEAATQRLTPTPREVRGSGIPEPQMATLQAWSDLAIMRGEKESDHLELTRLSRRQRDVLDLVCGEGQTIGATAKLLRAGVPSVRRALRGGLDVAGQNLKAALSKRQERKVNMAA